MNKNAYNCENAIKKRSVISFVIILILFFVCIIKLYILSTNKNLKEVASVQSTVKLNLYNLRGNIYDCNLEKITNENYEYKTIFLPTEEGIKTAIKLFENNSDELKRLQSGYAVLTNKKVLKNKGTVLVKVPVRYSNNQTAVHVIGYTDSQNNGVTGIEKGLNKYLYTNETGDFSYVTDAKKQLLSGVEYKINNKENKNGVVLTIDKKFQKILESEISKAECSAGVIIEAETGKIKAMASMPTYNINNLSKSINDKNSPFINRSLTPYSTGSVFKTCVSVAGLEKNLSKKTYYCKGYVTINNQRFNCHKKEGHGFVNLQKALAESCNCYFYNYAEEVGAEKIYNTAKLCGFGSSLNIGGGLVAISGVLPSLSVIKQNKNALANFAIGQGDFSVSPLVMTNLYSAVVNNGEYIYPYIVEGVYEKGKINYFENTKAKTKVMSKQTAETVKNMLKNCLKSGTGKAAKPKSAVAGGKTATAQTGWLKNGRKIDNSWFCGFFEANEKTYVVAILIEDINTQNVTCTELFKKISDKIYSLY